MGTEARAARPNAEDFQFLNRAPLALLLRLLCFLRFLLLKAPKPWTRREIARLGRTSDRSIAAKLGRGFDSVHVKRTKLGIPELEFL